MSETRLPLEDAYRWEREAPERPWLVQPFGGGKVETYTWAQALDEARRMAAHLQSLDLEPGSQIAMISKNCAHFVMADLAIWMAGHVSVALYPTLTAETIAYVLEHSDSKLLFVGKLDDLGEVRAGIPTDMPCISFPLAPENDYPSWNSIVGKHGPVGGNPSRKAGDVAVIIYTSGSTGQPKGVMHSFGAIANAVDGITKIFGANENDRMLSYLPLAHVYERFNVECQGLRAGYPIFFAETLDSFLTDLNRAAPTLFLSVPRLWLKFQIGVHKKFPPDKLARFLKIPILNRVVKKKVLAGLGLQHVRFAASASAPIPPELIQWYRDLGLELLEGYGMTEDFAYSHATFPGKGRFGYVGNSLPGVDVKINEEGEILVRSPGRMLGYYKDPAKTAECFTEDGFFKTGDRGERDDTGRLKITGRVKEIFKTSKGKYVAPAPIENLLNNHNEVELSCVTGAGNPQPYALVLPAEELRPRLSNGEERTRFERELEGLLASVNAEVEAFERIQFLVVVKEPWLIENGYLTPTLKIKRGRIEDAYGPNSDAWYRAGHRVIWATDASGSGKPVVRANGGA
ncbi:MAG: AMP-binding protein [Myxococcota bacterium]